MLKREWRYFLTAMQFYTRFPLKNFSPSDVELAKSARHFVAMGYLVTAMALVVFIGSKQFLAVEIALILFMIVSIFATGAFHEDGLADVADAFGGGYGRERILEIMKDSRLGTYGVVALVLALLLKYLLLIELYYKWQPHQLSVFYLALFTAATASRLAAASVTLDYQYARARESKSGFVVANVTVLDGLFMFTWAALCLILFANWQIWILLPTLFAVRTLLAQYFKKHIGGYTGDCLGAIQQVSEMVTYIFLLVL